jgi:hypothetical protein
VCGVWCVVCGVWCVVCGVWRVRYTKRNVGWLDQTWFLYMVARPNLRL